jgi:hypothetical protein
VASFAALQHNLADAKTSVWTNSMYCVVDYRLAAGVTAYDRLPLLAEDLGAMTDVQLVRV